jgi:hypothetical protein
VNITLALIAGLLLLLPGLAVLAAWNVQGGRHAARRPEIQLTSINALFIALIASLVAHCFGWSLCSLFISAGAQLRTAWPALPSWVGVPPNPFDTAILLIRPSSTAASIGPDQLFVLLIVLMAETWLAFRLTASEGLDLAIDGFDGRAQGWVYQNVVRPTRHGLQPVAYVLTTPPQGNFGLGYRGVVVEARQGIEGDIKVLALANPEQFVYEIVPGADDSKEASLRNSARRRLEGILAIEAATIRNILIQGIPDELLDDIAAAVPPPLVSDVVEQDTTQPETNRL